MGEEQGDREELLEDPIDPIRNVRARETLKFLAVPMAQLLSTWLNLPPLPNSIPPTPLKHLLIPTPTHHQHLSTTHPSSTHLGTNRGSCIFFHADLRDSTAGARRWWHLQGAQAAGVSHTLSQGCGLHYRTRLHRHGPTLPAKKLGNVVGMLRSK
jgi:hypothetical protein